MKQSFRAAVKSAVAKAMPESARLEVLCNLPKIESWRKKHLSKDCPHLEKRLDLYDYVQATYVKDQPVDYLEFGVYRGESIKHWSKINKSDQSRFFGFDTFTGLPEEWKKFSGDMPAGALSCGGMIPDVNDARIQFIKGLYQDTLDDFLSQFNPRSQVVLHDDSDLYSSTLFVLTRCHSLLTSEVIVIFDDFSSVLNQFRAIKDYCAAYRRNYTVLATAGDYFAHVAIRFA
jgi:O-methyltransferase